MAQEMNHPKTFSTHPGHGSARTSAESARADIAQKLPQTPMPAAFSMPKPGKTAPAD